MWPRPLLSRPLDHPIQALLVLSVSWKAFLLLVAVCSPGPGYDTSTTLLQPYDGTSLYSLIPRKLTRWDAIYFTKQATRGYVYEQEWAFGLGFPKLVVIVSRGLKAFGLVNYKYLESAVAIAISHVSHGLSVIVLFGLAQAICSGPSSHRLAFVTACLHIISPAGLFLSAPYGESTFALLSFLGYLLFVRSFSSIGDATLSQDLCVLLSGVILGFANLVRSNGLLNGLLFLEEAVRTLLSLKSGLTISSLRRLIITGLGGICIGAGFLFPQCLAYQEFCRSSPILGTQQPRVWCKAKVPSIYTFVQEHYWNVGFLRYWRVQNIPLFIIALPMLAILIISGLWAISNGSTSASASESESEIKQPKGQAGAELRRTQHLIRSLAVPQLVLAVMAITNYHVQIITRLASAHPIWYIWLASMLANKTATTDAQKQRDLLDLRHVAIQANPIIRYLMLYGLVQAGLFASFLPPA